MKFRKINLIKISYNDSVKLARLWLNFNPFLTNVPILYPLKTAEKQRSSGVFRGYGMGTLTRNGIILVATKL